MPNYTIGKKMTAFPPHAMNEQGAGPYIGSPLGSPVATSFSPQLGKVGNTLTAQTGAWRGLGSFNPKFQWFIGGSPILNATSATFSCAAATAGVLAARLSMGNATWGTWYKDMTVLTGGGTIQP